MSYVPRIRYSVTPIPCGYSASGTFAKIYAYDYQALLASQNHHKLPSGSWDGGGPFLMYSEKLQHQGSVDQPYKYFDTVYTGRSIGVSPLASTRVPEFPTPPSVVSVLGPLQDWGIIGFNKTKPGKPVADLGVFLTELRSDGLPTLPFTKGLFGQLLHGMPLGQIPRYLQAEVKKFLRPGSKNTGKEVLNVEFGWKPLVRDLRKLYYLWQTLDRRVADLVRNNGKGIRRKATLDETNDSAQEVHEYPYPWVGALFEPPPAIGGGTRYTVTSTTKTKTWYASKYVYWIPDTSSSLWGLRARAALFGALPTPELIWNAMPWSWLSDWFTDVGEIASAISPGAVDNLVQVYGYTMRHSITTVSAQCSMYHTWPPLPTYVYGRDWQPVDVTLSSTRITEIKARVSGFNPFGRVSNGLSDLSPKQVGILASLGLSKFGRS